MAAVLLILVGGVWVIERAFGLGPCALSEAFAIVEEELAKNVAGSNLSYTALGIIQAARETDAPLLDVANHR